MLDSNAIAAFIARAHKRSLPPKHTVLHAGDRPQSIYLILEGSVSVMLEDGDGREMVLDYLNPGEFFGEICLFPEQEVRSAMVRTRGPTLVAELDYEAFRRFVAEHPDCMFEIAGQLARRLRETGQRVANLAFLDVAGRLARTLHDLARKPDAQPHPFGKLVRISRMELARHIGCSREMAGRALKKLHDDGLVRPQGRNILIFPLDGPVELRNAA
ncbi:cyclic nucleotide-binding domain-containing protein [Sinimarinibacterium flocculans]|uniref:CRP/FNR family cyclic AMP-dependent transcriptional regulator n=1 Tax=Sinimarinibacterium flocculans TaxID=985250 RepID=A0A318E982_9GAMM|nr:cyclic nucleotide-binding domain-containing protein [Sinimarinibacterium flocculans]PXV67193.1 CRP/FNR family cyclic AMP-dependent transcriptional regulator [Sinimarinibacterium flocculans]